MQTVSLDLGRLKMRRRQQVADPVANIVRVHRIVRLAKGPQERPKGSADTLGIRIIGNSREYSEAATYAHW